MVRKKYISEIIRQKPEVVEEQARIEPEMYEHVLPEEIKPRNKKTLLRNIKIAVALLCIVAVVCAGLAYYFHWFGFGLSAQERAAQEALRFQEKASSLIIMPTEEVPVVAHVSDASALRNAQAFYKNVENDDVLLIYSVAQRAILYRPSTHILVNVGPIYLNEAAEKTETTPPLRVPTSTTKSRR